MFYVTGDLHGDACELLSRMSDIPEEDEGSTILIAGDVGIACGEEYNRDLVDVMVELPYTFVVMRGNHDTRYVRDFTNKRYGAMNISRVEWCGGPAVVDEYAQNIVYLADEGGMYHPNGHNMLVIPGAYSVDYDYRVRNGYQTEKDEKLSDSEMSRLSDMAAHEPIDVVVSHTCPWSWYPKIEDLFLGYVTQSSVDVSMERWLDSIYGLVASSCKRWTFGHYHADRHISGTCGRIIYHGIVPLV